MPIRIRPICRHCGQPIEQAEYFAPWYHTGRRDDDATKCNPRDPASTLAIPSIDVVKMGEP